MRSPEYARPAAALAVIAACTFGFAAMLSEAAQSTGGAATTPPGAPAPAAKAAQAKTADPSTAVARTASAVPWAGIGRPATRSEIHAWDIDVRADFKGLPPGSGSVEAGERVWEEKCAVCHGTFGESNEVFTPIVGGTTKEDIESGHVANLKRTDFPQRSTMMKLSQVSTLWDYIRRAMPWNAPKSLSTDEVYAVTAYILHLADVVPADYTLTERNIADVQKRLPNRHGLTFYEPMWRVDGKPDVQGDACMHDCAVDPARLAVAGLPEHARDAHGNLMAQNRIVGPVRGADTTRPPRSDLDGAEVAALAEATMLASIPHQRKPEDLAREANCMACHAVDAKMVGPSFRDVGAKYRGRPGVAEMLVGRVKNGTSGVWGDVPMPANAAIADDDIRVIVNWILEDRR
ncbi:MAG: c-type cytochrome [Burkholderiaceae bacterium]|nr:c-type cytochrome [Burkholderiaceae bacterium]